MAAAPKISKDELRAQVEKLARANANLRGKNRELKRAAVQTAERIADLETELRRRDSAGAKPAASRDRGTPRRPAGVVQSAASDRDPENTVPPGIAAGDKPPRSEAGQEAPAPLNGEPASE